MKRNKVRLDAIMVLSAGADGMEHGCALLGEALVSAKSGGVARGVTSSVISGQIGRLCNASVS